MADITPEQAIEKLKALPEDKQRAVLLKLSPEQRKGILGQLNRKKTITSPAEAKASFSERLTSPYSPEAAEFGESHPVLGVPVRAASALGGTILGLPGFLYHSVADPLTTQETEEFKGHTRIPGEVAVERLLGARQIVEAGKSYADPKTRPTLKTATELLPEALGTGAGAYVGGELMGRGLSKVGELRRAAAERIQPTARKVTGVEPAVKEAVTKGAEKHGEALADTEAQKQAAVERGGQARTVDQQSVKLREHLERVQKAAKAEGDAKFDKVREKLGVTDENPGPSTDPTTLVNAVKHVEANVLQNIPENIKEFRAILKHEPLPEGVQSAAEAAAEQGGFELEGPEPLTWKKLQSLKSRLDARLRKPGSMNGELKRGLYDTRDAVVNEMGQMADANGATGEWAAARDFWRNYKQDFEEPQGPSGSGSPVAKALNAVDPANIRGPFLGAVDSTLGNRGAAILRRYPQHGGAEAAAAIEGLVGEHKKLGFMGKEKNPNPPAPKPPTVDVNKVAKDAMAKRAANWGQFNARDVGILSSGVIGEFLGSMFGHGTVDRALGAITGVAAYEGGKYTLSRLMNRPGVIEYLSNIPEAEVQALSKIPGADKIKIVDGLTNILAQGKAKNLSPGVRSLIGPANVSRVLAAGSAVKTPGEAKDRLREFAPQ